MEMIQRQLSQTRRDFLTSSASGLGGVALSSMLLEDGLLGAEFANPMAPRKPHFDAKAKACIFIFMAGAPSHLDLFDPKPVLNQRAGKKLPKEILDKARFAFIQPATATLQASGNLRPRRSAYRRYRQQWFLRQEAVVHPCARKGNPPAAGSSPGQQ